MNGISGTIRGEVVFENRPKTGKVIMRRVDSQSAEHTRGKNQVGYGPQSG